MDGKPLDSGLVHSVYLYFVMFIAILFFGTIFLLIFEPLLDIQTAFSGVLTSISGVGPGLSVLGPAGTFAFLSPYSKLFLSIVMLIGRLEIFPILMLFSLRTWSVKRFN